MRCVLRCWTLNVRVLELWLLYGPRSSCLYKHLSMQTIVKFKNCCRVTSGAFIPHLLNWWSDGKEYPRLVLLTLLWENGTTSNRVHWIASIWPSRSTVGPMAYNIQWCLQKMKQSPSSSFIETTNEFRVFAHFDFLSMRSKICPKSRMFLDSNYD